MNIDTFIFDLGGVIIDLNESATTQQFASAAGITINDVVASYTQSNVFQAYEKGFLSDSDFRDGIRKIFNTPLSDLEIDRCWNAMLGEITLERLALLSDLCRNHRVLILSNTNSIHECTFNKILQSVSGKPSLHDFADQVFFSHELGMRKPDVAIYEEILNLSKTNPSKALFMDDKQENLRGAEAAGINTMLITSPNEILKLRKYVGE